jgi:precorrin-2 dehydrogenase/sirohydrochlorin ferrochelatase
MKNKSPHPNYYYPMFVDLRGKTCVVVGGGRIAERKTLDLVKTGGKIKVISPELTSRLQKEKDKGSIRHIARRFRHSDLKGAFLVVAATDDQAVNEQVAGAKDILINVVDQPALCNFIVPSSIKQGPLSIAISTSGTSPAMARAIRKDMEAFYGPPFGEYLKDMKKQRAKALRDIPDPKERERHLKSLASVEQVQKLKKASAKRHRDRKK